MIEHALKYLKNGLNVIATDNNKRSLFSWKPFQSQMITPEGIKLQLSHHKATGIAIICGAISGNLEVIDVDLKNDVTGTLEERLVQALVDAGLFDLLKVARTRSGGLHLYYRCSEIEGNKKLAMRPATDQELIDNPQLKQVVIIETRGEAGYVIAPPTDGYKWQDGKLQEITPDQRHCILEVCRSFNEVYEQIETPINARPEGYNVDGSPFDDYNQRGDVINLLQKHGWTVVGQKGVKTIFKRPGTTDSKSSGDYNSQLGWFSVFTTNSVFEPNKAYRPYAVYAILECNGDFKEACKRLAGEGYGERKKSYGDKFDNMVIARARGGEDKEDIIKDIARKKNCDDIAASAIFENIISNEGPQLLTFWTLNSKGSPIFNRGKFIDFLHFDLKYSIYYLDDKNKKGMSILQECDNMVKIVNIQEIKESVMKWCTMLPACFDTNLCPDDIRDLVLKNVFIFNENMIEFIPVKKFDFIQDTKEKCHIPFKNGVAIINQHGDVELKTYGSIGKYVWKDLIRDHHISIDQEFDASLCEYARFVHNISNNEQSRFKSSCEAIGYMIHGYKDKSRSYSVILAEETDSEEKGGGTGKGIFMKAIAEIINVMTIDGKTFSLDKPFALQRVTPSTRLIVIEDAKKTLDFEKFYNMITEGVTVERKNKDEVFYTFKESPKVGFTTNYSIYSNAEHGKRRQRVIEFAPHYSTKWSPKDDFGHILFDDWDSDEWNRFYNFMFFCVGCYLDNGFDNGLTSDAMRKKHIKTNFGEEFSDWWKDYMENGRLEYSFLQSKYEDFVSSNGYEKKDYSMKRFKKALQTSCENFNLIFDQRKLRTNNNKPEFRVLDNE